MPDRFLNLVRDTLAYLKDPLSPRQSILTTAENYAFFQKDEVKEPTIIQKQENRFPQPQQRTTFTEKAAAQPKPAAHNTPSSSKPVQPIAADNAMDSTQSPIKKTLQRIAPNLKLIDQIPDDEQAKRIASAWKEKISDAEVILLVCDSNADTLEFLKGLAKAIDQHLAKVKILMAERLEREKRWDLFLDKNSFRLIIASDGMQKLPELMRFYKSVPASAQFFLDKTPLLVLSSSTVYKSLEHKALLWKTLCQLLKK
jgi:hypothetical protein